MFGLYGLLAAIVLFYALYVVAEMLWTGRQEIAEGYLLLVVFPFLVMGMAATAVIWSITRLIRWRRQSMARRRFT